MPKTYFLIVDDKDVLGFRAFLGKEKINSKRFKCVGISYFLQYRERLLSIPLATFVFFDDFIKTTETCPSNDPIYLPENSPRELPSPWTVAEGVDLHRVVMIEWIVEGMRKDIFDHRVEKLSKKIPSSRRVFCSRTIEKGDNGEDLVIFTGFDNIMDLLKNIGKAANSKD